MDLAKALRDNNEKVNSLVERGIVAQGIADELLKSLHPRGYYNIPMLLDERRFDYGIPNGAFEQFPVFDKVYIWQVTTQERRTYSEGGAVLKPDAVISSDQNTAPRGVIVSAGLQALDSLRSTGIDLGHIVRFKKFAPFIQPVAEIHGRHLTVMVIRDGDIVASEDLAKAYFVDRTVSIVNASTDGLSYDHRLATVHEGTGDVSTTGKKVSAYYDPSV
jgi:hypothetical protein